MLYPITPYPYAPFSTTKSYSKCGHRVRTVRRRAGASFLKLTPSWVWWLSPSSATRVFACSEEKKVMAVCWISAHAFGPRTSSPVFKLKKSSGVRVTIVKTAFFHFQLKTLPEENWDKRPWWISALSLGSFRKTI